MPRTFVCRSEDLPEGKGRWVKLVPGKEAYVFRLKGIVTSFVNRCTHMGGPVELTPAKDQLRCRRHEATFDPQTGVRTGGQAPEGSALDPLETEENEEGIWVIWSLPHDPFAL